MDCLPDRRQRYVLGVLFGFSPVWARKIISEKERGERGITSQDEAAFILLSEIKRLAGDNFGDILKRIIKGVEDEKGR